MKLRTSSPEWFSEDQPGKEAKCVLFPSSPEYDPWFTEDEEEMEDAKAICHGIYDGKPCPLLAQCLEFAVTNNERYGIWGGMTPQERADLRKERRYWRRRNLAQVGSSQQED